MTIPKIPYSFVSLLTDICWSDVHYAYKHKLIGDDFVKEYVETIARKDSADFDIVLLKGGRVQEIEPILEHLVAGDYVPKSHLNRKWLYLALDWALEMSSVVADPLGVVEEIYAQFNYPTSIENFVRFMPMIGPDLGSLEKNTRRLFDRWQEFTRTERTKFLKNVGLSL